MSEIWRLRRDEFWVAAPTAAVVVGIGVEQGIVLAIVLSLILHVRRHYAPADRVVSWDAAGHLETLPATPGTFSEPGLVVYRFGVGVFYAKAERLSEEIIGIVDIPEPPRWLVLDARTRSTTSTTRAARPSPSSPTSSGNARSCSPSPTPATPSDAPSTASASPTRSAPTDTTTASKPHAMPFTPPRASTSPRNG
jgi:hypothetical protein